MSVKSIKRLLKDSIVAHFSLQASGQIGTTPVVASFAGVKLEDRHIRVTTGQMSPQKAGETNLGRWNVTAAITAVSQIDDTDNDAHDNLIGLIEGYVLQGNKTLATALTTAEIKVENVTVGDGVEVTIEGMLYSGQEIQCECYMLAT